MLEKRESPLSLYIKEHLDRSPLSDDEVGILCGFKNGNLIRAIAEGEIRPPLDRLATLAEVLGCKGGQLFTLAITQWFHPELIETLQKAFLAYPSLEHPRQIGSGQSARSSADGFPR